MEYFDHQGKFLCLLYFFWKDITAIKNKFLMFFILGSQTENQSFTLLESPLHQTHSMW